MSLLEIAVVEEALQRNRGALRMDRLRRLAEAHQPDSITERPRERFRHEVLPGSSLSAEKQEALAGADQRQLARCRGFFAPPEIRTRRSAAPPVRIGRGHFVRERLVAKALGGKAHVHVLVEERVAGGCQPSRNTLAVVVVLRGGRSRVVAMRIGMRKETPDLHARTRHEERPRVGTRREEHAMKTSRPHPIHAERPEPSPESLAFRCVDSRYDELVIRAGEQQRRGPAPRVVVKAAIGIRRDEAVDHDFRAYERESQQVVALEKRRAIRTLDHAGR